MGHVIEYRGAAIRALSMEGRMTMCNMSIEAGARAGHGRPRRHDLRLPRRASPRRRAARCGSGPRRLAEPRHRRGRGLRQDSGHRRGGHRAPRHVGHEPGAGGAHRRGRPDPDELRRRRRARGRRPGPRSTWASTPGRRCATSPSTRSSSVRAPTPASRTCGPRPPSCEGRHVRSGMRALVVPGSHPVKAQAEAEGLDKVFVAAGFEWREPGCSMCLAMNPDKLAVGRTVRVDLEPQLRGSPGPGRPHPPGLAGRGRRHRRGGTLRHPRGSVVTGARP